MRGEKRLTARQVTTLGEGYHADGGGLYLQVTATGARSWIYRFQRQGKRREMGLGPLSAVSLAQARDRAAEARTQLAFGQDPIAQRKAAQTTGITFGECADAYIESHRGGWKNGAQGDQWAQSLRDHGPARSLPVAVSENTMLYLVQKPVPKGFGLPFTVHGFRSSFRDWAAETTDHAGEVVEMALAHAIRNKAEAAYRRGTLLEKRRQLMDAWAAYLKA